MDDNAKTGVDAWLTGRDLREFFANARRCDVKVRVNDCYVPVREVSYDARLDNYVIVLDEEDEEYVMAMTTDPIPEPDR